MDVALVDLVNHDVLQAYFGEFDGRSPGPVIAKILQEVGSDHSNAQASKQMEATLSLVLEKEPELAARLHKVALCHLADAITQKLLVIIDEGRKARFASLEKDFPTIRALLPSGILQFQPVPSDEFAGHGESLKGGSQ
jgi:hypothetical protein